MELFANLDASDMTSCDELLEVIRVVQRFGWKVLDTELLRHIMVEKRCHLLHVFILSERTLN